MTQYGDALLRVRPSRRVRLGKLTLDAELQRLTQGTVDAAGREIHRGRSPPARARRCLRAWPSRS